MGKEETDLPTFITLHKARAVYHWEVVTDTKLFQDSSLGNAVCRSGCRTKYSDDASGWAPEFGSSVNLITTRGADYAHHITTSPPGFENPMASLL